MNVTTTCLATLLFAAAMCRGIGGETGAADDSRIASDSEFPAPGAATPLSGEITLVEHVNRRGILRLDRDGEINKYHWDLPHEFQMLPYGAIYLHGAPAELRDVPIGTHLHGQFHLGPEGDFKVDPPESGYVAGNSPRPDMRSVVSQFSRVLQLEDDFSFYQRQGAGWKIKSVSENPGQIVVERVRLKDGTPDVPESEAAGMTGEQTFRVDEGTRVWKEGGISSLADLAPGQVVQVNLGWVTLLGPAGQDGLCREIWIDEASRQAATAQQRGVHLAHQKRRGIPATVLKTESMPGEGARGHMTVELHHGVDPSLLESIQGAKGVMVQAVEPTLRAYDGGDGKPASQLEVSHPEDPAPGSSGVRIRMHLYEMVEGFRAGRTVRIGLSEWKMPDRPLEEKLWPVDVRKFSVGSEGIAGREPQVEGSE